MTLTKVTFHYSDGSSKYITGRELEQWNRFNSLVAGLANNHGMNPDWESIKWTKEEYKFMDSGPHEQWGEASTIAGFGEENYKEDEQKKE